MIRFALIQAGAQAAAVARVAARWRGGEITCVVEPTAQAAQQVAKQVGATVWATSAQQLHEKQDGAFDTWLAATPLGWLIVPHANQPLRLDPDQWHDHPDGWQWGNAYRFLPSVMTVKESLDSKKLGEPGLVRIHAWGPSPPSDAHQRLLPQLELACWLVNQPPTVVFAQARPRDDEAGATQPGYVQAHLGFADDRMAVIDSSTALPTGSEYYSLSVIGSTGAAYVDDHHDMQLLLAGGPARAIRSSQGDRALLATVQEFLDSTIQSRAPRCGAVEWNLTRRVAAAVRRSLQSGQAASLAGGAAP